MICCGFLNNSEFFLVSKFSGNYIIYPVLILSIIRKIVMFLKRYRTYTKKTTHLEIKHYINLKISDKPVHTSTFTFWTLTLCFDF